MYRFDLRYGMNNTLEHTGLNLKLRIGFTTEMLNKVMKEVQGKIFAGHFKTPI